MNQHIFELIQQQNGDCGLVWSEEDKEKFAELIVRECMTMSSELKAEYLRDRKQETDFSVKNIYAEGEAACDTLKYRMKKHFGVES